MPNITNLTPPRVPLVDPNTGYITREWYLFLFNLFNLTGAGTSDISITDLAQTAIGQDLSTVETQINALAVQPAATDISVTTQKIEGLAGQPNASALLSQIAELQKQLDGLKMAVMPQLGTMAELQQANLPWVTFDTTPQNVPTDVGTVAWDGGTTLGVQATANVLMRVGESEFVYAKASSAITKGQLCYHTGSVGSSGVITVAPTPLALSDPNQIVGVAAEDIALNGFGLIQISGDLRGFNTTGASVGETWADGDYLYYNPSYVGAFTKNKPVAPSQKTFIGEIINAGSGGSGAINIRIVYGTVLGGTDSNVQITTPVNLNLLQYDGTLNYWKNVTNTSVTVGTANNLSGGAANQIAYQTGAGATSFIVAPTVSNTYLEWSGSAFQWSANPLGTVTSVDVSGGTTGLTFSGGPITSSGTITMAGTLAVGNGGTGQTTYTDGQLLIGNSTGNTLTKATLTAGTGITITNGSGSITIANTMGGGAPVTKTANFTVAAGETWIINNKSGSTCTVTLPTASASTGRTLTFQNYQAQLLVSASSNVVPLGGGAAGTAILDAVVGNWATMVSDGTNWIIMQDAPNNALVLE